MQTSYSRTFVNAFSGMLGDSGTKYIQSRVNASGSDIPAGIAVKDTSTEGNADLLSSASDMISGIVVNSFARDPGSAGNSLTGSNAIKSLNEMNILSEGVIFVFAEQTVGVTDKVFVRYGNSNVGAQTQKGAFRKDADSVAQVVTVTPTAVDSTVYVLRVEVGGKNFIFEFKSGTSTTATLITTGFKTVMAADAEFTALVVASGTATLILTSQNTSNQMVVQGVGDGALAVAQTTAFNGSARQVKAARWVRASGTSGVAAVYFSAIAESVQMS